MMKAVAIITARGGSKRIPRKNIRQFCGKPMIAWPIETALASGIFDHVYVSTEDAEIAEIAKEHGAEVPVFRPMELADDMADARSAATHMLQWVLDNVGYVPHLAHIYPTAPLLCVADLERGYELVSHGKQFAYTAQRIGFPFFQAVTLDGTGSPAYFFPMEKAMMRSQDMPDFYIDAGQLYWHQTEPFLRVDRTKGAIIEIEPMRAIDIDTENDWEFAEMCMQFILKNRQATSPDT